MVDLEPFLDAPFEEASNLSFEVLLGLGVALLAAVAVLGRSRVTMAAVAVYLLLIPGYVGYRIRAWDGIDEGGEEGADEAAADANGNRDGADGDDGEDGENGGSDPASGESDGDPPGPRSTGDADG